MAQPPVDRRGGELLAGDMPRMLPTPFLTKTYQLVDDRATDDVISWNCDGSSFVVWNQAEFARDLLPKYFKHNNFSSFIRQLNTYGFRKIVADRWEFSNECFRRGEKRLLCDIQRRKMAATQATSAAVASPSDSGEGQVISSSAGSFCSSTEELIGENERLRKENQQLNKELSHMKNLCNSIHVLMSNYAGNDGTNAHQQHPQPNCKLNTAELKPLDLLPMTRFCEIAAAAAAANGGEGCSMRTTVDEIGARLFGVPIGGKHCEGTSRVDEMDLDLQLPVNEIKYEALDDEDCNLSGGDYYRG